MMDYPIKSGNDGGIGLFSPKTKKAEARAPAFIILFRGLALAAPITCDHAGPIGLGFCA